MQCDLNSKTKTFQLFFPQIYNGFLKALKVPIKMPAISLTSDLIPVCNQTANHNVILGEVRTVIRRNYVTSTLQILFTIIAVVALPLMGWPVTVPVKYTLSMTKHMIQNE